MLNGKCTNTIPIIRYSLAELGDVDSTNATKMSWNIMVSHLSLFLFVIWLLVQRTSLDHHVFWLQSREDLSSPLVERWPPLSTPPLWIKWWNFHPTDFFFVQSFAQDDIFSGQVFHISLFLSFDIFFIVPHWNDRQVNVFRSEVLWVGHQGTGIIQFFNG